MVTKPCPTCGMGLPADDSTGCSCSEAGRVNTLPASFGPLPVRRVRPRPAPPGEGGTPSTPAAEEIPPTHLAPAPPTQAPRLSKDDIAQLLARVRRCRDRLDDGEPATGDVYLDDGSRASTEAASPVTPQDTAAPAAQPLGRPARWRAVTAATAVVALVALGATFIVPLRTPDTAAGASRGTNGPAHPARAVDNQVPDGAGGRPTTPPPFDTGMRAHRPMPWLDASGRAPGHQLHPVIPTAQRAGDRLTVPDGGKGERPVRSIPADAGRPVPDEPSQPSSESQPSDQPPVLNEGDTGQEVRELQLRLKRWSCDLFCLLLDVVDGEYDARVTEAVAKFQTAKQVDGDPAGVYGPNTRRALEAVTSIE